VAGLTIRAGARWNKSIGNQSSVAVTVSVTRADGADVTGLSVTDFGLYVLDGNGKHLISSPQGFTEFSAPPGGLYELGTGVLGPVGTAWSGDQIVIVVQVEAGGDRGRAMVDVVF
jgi:hypothetical protein